MPHVAAIARTPTASSTRAGPDRDRRRGRRPGRDLHAVPDHVDDQDGRTTAALQQKERGELDFDAPVEEYCPEFADVKVLEGWDGDQPRLVEPRTKATVHQLVTHTSGLSTGSGTRTS